MEKIRLYSPKEEMKLFLLCFLPYEIIFILMLIVLIVNGVSNYYVIIVGFVFWTFLFINLLLNEIFFEVRVYETKIKVRTKYRREYEINLSGIRNVTCGIKAQSEKLRACEINIETETRKIHMKGSLVGFREMAEYISEKYQTGEINQSAMDEYCQENLDKILNMKS